MNLDLSYLKKKKSLTNNSDDALGYKFNDLEEKFLKK